MPKITISDLEQVLEISDDAVLYDALFEQGIELPHGCLSGSCGACRVEILTPESLVEPGAVEKNTIEAINEERINAALPALNIRLSCRAKIKSDTKIKLIKD